MFKVRHQLRRCAAIAGVCVATMAFACQKTPAKETAADAGPQEGSAEGPQGGGPGASKTSNGQATAAGGSAATLPDAKTLLDKAVQASGGRERFAQVQSFYAEGTIELAAQNISGDLRVWWDRTGFYTESNMFGIGHVRAGGANGKSWMQDPVNGLRELHGKEAEQASWASSLSLVSEWSKFFETATTVGEREIDGQAVYDVMLKSATGDEVKLSFAKDSGMHVEQSFRRAGPMGEMPVSIRLQDYRELEGMKVSFRQVTDGSLAKMTQQLTTLKLNAPVDRAKFAMPSIAAGQIPAPAVHGGKDHPSRQGMPYGPDGKPGRPVPAGP